MPFPKPPGALPNPPDEAPFFFDLDAVFIWRDVIPHLFPKQLELLSNAGDDTNADLAMAAASLPLTMTHSASARLIPILNTIFAVVNVWNPWKLHVWK